MNGLVVIEIPERLPSWNILYAGVNHHVRTAMKNKWKLIVRAALPSDTVMLDVPVHITIVAEYKGVGCDPDNLCDKLIIDGLKGLLIKDDTAEYIKSVTSRVVWRGKRNHIVVYVEKDATE